MKATCQICPNHCTLDEGETGICRGRVCRGGKIVCENYGRVTSLALDPIEKKPLALFHPGSKILSVGSYGCNLHCPFCQNWEISSADEVEYTEISPEWLVAKAEELKSEGNIGLAYTYNEPLISYEFVLDCAALAHRKGLLNVLVSNGMICTKPLQELLPYIDAANIDLKGFTEEFYRKIGGRLETVKSTINDAIAAGCHVEVTTLVIPGENDSKQEIENAAKWLASINPEIPYHLSRFFPQYKMTDRPATPVKTIYELAAIASRHLKNVFTGNC